MLPSAERRQRLVFAACDAAATFLTQAVSFCAVVKTGFLYLLPARLYTGSGRNLLFSAKEGAEATGVGGGEAERITVARVSWNDAGCSVLEQFAYLLLPLAPHTLRRNCFTSSASPEARAFLGSHSIRLGVLARAAF